MLQRKKSGGLANGLIDLAVGEGFSWVIASAFKPLLPIVTSMLTLWYALSDDLPLWLIIPLVSVAFAGTLVGVNNVDSFWARRRIKDEVSVSDVQVVEALNASGNEIIGYNVYLIVSNRAEVPIEYVIRDSSGSLDGMSFPDLADSTASGEVEPNGVRLHGLGTVPARPETVGRVHIPGKVKLRLDYARTGRKFAQCEAKAKFDFTVLTDALGNVQRTNTRILRD